ncbi:MAG: hypothetical protein CYPHOPRED_003645 [Cyphobasidiales sp. Tagirdzhanova-0007]|nr:MAG: hypothetical protein CYPHOPRED_003645 [Cyphobasidiales sp. Tagirdzhanova-0007]
MATGSMPAAGPASARLGGIRHKIDSTSIGNDHDAAMQKNYEDAKKGDAAPEPNSEGHSLDRTGHAMGAQDAHTEQLTKAHDQRGSGRDSGSQDAIDLSSGENHGKAEAKRKANATSEGSKFQPGQGGDQVGGKGGETDGKGGELGGAVYGEGMSGTSDAPKAGTGSGLGQAVKNMLGGGPTNGFHTYARIRMPSSVPEEAVKKGARKPKEMDVGGEQTPHLPHHSEGQGDKMPAVRNSASLPSKMGDKSSTKANQVAATGTNEGKGPSHEMRPTGTASSPGSRAVDPSQAKHSPSFSPSVGPSATYTHVIGTPEPDSHQQAYTYSTESANGSPPSGIAPRSSTSTSPYPNHTTDGILKNEAGIGSSNSMINEPLKGADEMMDKQDSGAVEAGQAGDDVGGRGQTGGRPYNPPPDVGEIEQDTLPKAIK